MPADQTSVGDRIFICVPESVDGVAVHALIAACPPLDANSLYCNLLQCSDFADTCAIARCGGEAVGFLSAYRKPKAPDTLFVWQVAVREDARGRGLARKMLFDVLSRPDCASVRRVEATITEGNTASWVLFRSLADALGASFSHAPLFERETHFGGIHDTEMLISIGPFDPVDKTNHS